VNLDGFLGLALSVVVFYALLVVLAYVGMLVH
jgi:hypothetical protein